MRKVAFVFPHQLFYGRQHWWSGDLLFCLIEDEAFFRQFKFHKKKLILHRASMQAYHDHLCSLGFRVRYFDSVSSPGLASVFEKLETDGPCEIHVVDPVDERLKQRLSGEIEKRKWHVREYAAPAFLCTQRTLRDFFEGKSKCLMHTFYVRARKNLGILTKYGKPEGGKWSFEFEKEERPPKIIQPPSIRKPKPSRYVAEAVSYVEKHFGKNWGESSDFFYSVTAADARLAFEDFLEKRLANFGTYQEAISSTEPFLFHSLLSPSLNLGLLTPEEVLARTLEFARRNRISIEILESFLRQIVGWREFVRGVYVARGEKQRTMNIWENKRKLPSVFWKGSTGIPPVDTAIRRVLTYGYAHHIERLMVLGNFMLLCEIDPADVYEWFMTLSVDACDWAAVPNVFGLSQYADGGLMAAKPYVSSGSYILKMSDYKRGSWCDIWSGLYWRFIDLHQDHFAQNFRTSEMVKRLGEMDRSTLENYVRKAEDFLCSLS